MRSPAAFGALLVYGFAGLGLVTIANAQVVRIPGTSVAMAAPPGFKTSRNPPGLANAETGSTIVIAELPPDSYKETVGVFSSPKTASNRYSGQGVRFTRIEQLTIGTAQVPLAIGGQAENGLEVKKYIAVLGGAQSGTKTTLITFSITGSDSFGQSDVEAALRSVALARVPTLDEKLARLAFTFKAVPPFHTSDVINGGSAAMLATFEGADPTAEKPIVVIERLGTTATPAELAQMSERVMRAAPEFKDAEISEQKAATFAGGDGYFIAAAGEKLAIRQFTRVLPGGRYIRLFARGELGALDEASDAITEIASSVALPE